MEKHANKQVNIMEQHKSEIIQDAVDLSEHRPWQPEVLAVEQTAAGSKNDFDVSEVWLWYHARLKLLGKLSNAQARLFALLNWREPELKGAIHAARLEVNRMHGDDCARQAHLEYLAAEHLAREALGIAAIPRVEPRPA